MEPNCNVILAVTSIRRLLRLRHDWRDAADARRSISLWISELRRLRAAGFYY